MAKIIIILEDHTEQIADQYLLHASNLKFIQNSHFFYALPQPHYQELAGADLHNINQASRKFIQEVIRLQGFAPHKVGLFAHMNIHAKSFHPCDNALGNLMINSPVLSSEAGIISTLCARNYEILQRMLRVKTEYPNDNIIAVLGRAHFGIFYHLVANNCDNVFVLNADPNYKSFYAAQPSLPFSVHLPQNIFFDLTKEKVEPLESLERKGPIKITQDFRNSYAMFNRAAKFQLNKVRQLVEYLSRHNSVSGTLLTDLRVLDLPDPCISIDMQRQIELIPVEIENFPKQITRQISLAHVNPKNILMGVAFVVIIMAIMARLFL